MAGPSLNDLIGQEILAVINFLHATQLQLVKLLAVEVGGIWIESENFTQKTLRDMNVSVATRTPALFVPYSEIRYILDAIDKTAISRKAFGV